MLEILAIMPIWIGTKIAASENGIGLAAAAAAAAAGCQQDRKHHDGSGRQTGCLHSTTSGGSARIATKRTDWQANDARLALDERQSRKAPSGAM